LKEAEEKLDHLLSSKNSKRNGLIDDVESGKTKLDEDALGKKRKKGDQTRASNYAEMKVDEYFETKTFRIGNNQGTLKRVSSRTVKSLDKKIGKGIDGIYEFSTPPPKYIITEVKYNKAVLSKDITKSNGSQMSELWIDFDLIKGAVSPEIISNFINNQREKMNIDKFGYGFGYLIGAIIQMILEILFTGGAKTIGQATAKFIGQIDDILKAGGKAIRKTATLPVDIFDKIIYFARALDEFAKNLPKYLDDFSKNIKNFLENVKDLIKEIWDKLSTGSRKRLENWGLKPTKLDKNYLSLCPINP
jgi:hypothetical protein